jgi:DNA polymerase-3 subunit alpha
MNQWNKTCGCSRPAIHWSNDFNARICQNCGIIIGQEEEQKIPFVHLRVHTHLSLLKAICKTKDLIKKAQEYGMSALAKTEHGGMFGVPTFIKECVDADIKPIVGVDFNIKINNNYYSVTFIALNRIGYKNLVQMTTTAWCKRKEKKDLFILIDDIIGEGLIALIEYTPNINELMLTGIQNKVELHLEIHNDKDFESIQNVAAYFSLSVVLTNNVHFTNFEDYEAYNTALKIGKIENAVDNECYFKSSQEMSAMGFHLEWFENAIKIADRVEDYGLINKEFIIPTFKDKHGEWSIEQAAAKLDMTAWTGLSNKGLADKEEYVKRLQYELEVIKEKKFSSYFLIINDIVEYMKRNGELRPIGRGSSVGSLVCYCLEITAKDPVRWGIPFERFINAGRVDLPDVDTDITQEGRPAVLRYIADTHGYNRVAQIATFQTMALKASIDNVGRALNVPHMQNRDLRNKIPDEVTTMEKVPAEVKKIMSNVEGWVDNAIALSGIAKNSGYHAAGVVISNRSLGDLVPLMPDNEGLLGIQYDMKDIEILGLLKLDMLGLKTLDIIKHSLTRIKDRYNVDLDIYNLSDQDKDTHELISTGNYVSIFQLDSPGYRKLCRKLQPKSFQHVMALNALYRPGPLEGGMTDEYVERRHGRQKLIGWHPWLDETLSITYQVPVFQEQVMAIAKVIAGFDDMEADAYRKAIGKKIKVKFDAAQEKFKKRALARKDLFPPDGYEGTKEQWLNGMLESLAGYARYGWNLGHSAGYGWITYITAYLEKHYPHEYYASLLDAADKPNKKTSLIKGILHKKIKVIPPHINNSGFRFEVGDDNAIYMGLASIRACGKATDQILEERQKRGKFVNFIDFCQRLPSINKTIKTNLVKAGTFSWDQLLTDRNKIDNIEIINKLVKKRTKKIDGSKTPTVEILMNCFIDSNEFTDIQRQENEREVLNSFITGHPAVIYRRLAPFLERGDAKIICPSDLQNCAIGENVLMIGMIDLVKKKATVRGRNPGTPYLNLVLSDNELNILTNIWYPLCNEMEKILTEKQIAMLQCVTRKDKFREDMVTLHVTSGIMLINGIPIQGVFTINGDDPKILVESIGGAVENITEISGRSYASIRGSRITVMPNILEKVIEKYPKSKFLLSMDSLGNNE